MNKWSIDIPKDINMTGSQVFLSQFNLIDLKAGIEMEKTCAILCIVSCIVCKLLIVNRNYHGHTHTYRGT